MFRAIVGALKLFFYWPGRFWKYMADQLEKLNTWIRASLR
jgi:hypothetical protein